LKPESLPGHPKATSSKPSALNTGIAIYEVRDGRVTRAWLETDRLGALQQIGAIG
jgi:hypothetical protein